MSDEEQLDEQDAVIIVKQSEKQPEAQEVGAKVEPTSGGPEQKIKCPICGNINPSDSEKCSICWTKLSMDAETNELTVSSPKEQGEVFTMIDLDDPMTRKRLEELTMIPGVSKRKALYLYRSGITNLEEFVEKAFHGDRRGANFSRMVANKIIVSSMTGKEKEDAKITCPHCDSETGADSETCCVCGKPLGVIDMEEVSETLGVVASSYLEELSENEDFAALPEDMRMQMAAVLESDSDTAVDIREAVESLGGEFKELDIVEGSEPGTPDGPSDVKVDEITSESVQKSAQAAVESAEIPPETTSVIGDIPEKKKPSTSDKKRAILVKKIKEWYEAGYDVSGLYELIDGDLGTFKEAAKAMIKKGVNK